MIDIQTNVATTVKKSMQMRVNRVDLLDVINQELKAQGAATIPPNASVYMSVPGGADWSNCSLDVDPDNPVIIEWEEVTHD